MKLLFVINIYLVFFIFRMFGSCDLVNYFYIIKGIIKVDGMYIVV